MSCMRADMAAAPQDAQGLLEEIASQRSRVYGLFLTAPYTTRLTRLRTEMFNNVHVLTLAYVIRLGGNDGGLAAGSTSRLFDATRFLSCTDAQEFWLTHAGITVSRAPRNASPPGRHIGSY